MTPIYDRTLFSESKDRAMSGDPCATDTDVLRDHTIGSLLGETLGLAINLFCKRLINVGSASEVLDLWW